MSKHTPGPWDVFGAQDSSSDKWRALTVSQASMPFMRVCFMPSDGTETIMADARLIAAAPDLLEALRELVKPANPDGHCHTGICTEDRCGECGRHARARAAIAKAQP